MAGEVLEEVPELGNAPPPPRILLNIDNTNSIPPEPLQPDDNLGKEDDEAHKDHGACMLMEDTSDRSVNLTISTACDSWERPANLTEVAPRYSLRSAKKLNVQHKIL